MFAAIFGIPAAMDWWVENQQQAAKSPYSAAAFALPNLSDDQRGRLLQAAEAALAVDEPDRDRELVVEAAGRPGRAGARRGPCRGASA